MNRNRLFYFSLFLIGLFFGLNFFPIQVDSLVSQVLYGSSGNSPLEWLKEIEMDVVGQISEDGLLERLSMLEELMTGRNRTGSLEERFTHLDSLLYTNQPYDICVLYKIQALEWILYKEESTAAIKLRLEKLEKDVFGVVYSGPVTKRVEKLIGQVFPDGVIPGRWANIPEGLLIKVQIMDELNSQKNGPGDQFRIMVMDNVFDRNCLLFPRGTVGKGVLKEVRHPDNLGRDAQLMIDFAIIRALDATPVRLFYGAKALKMDRSRQWAVGASAAGMLAFGPGGILLGLVIKGKETTIPTGTEFYLQVSEPVRIYTLFEPGSQGTK
jgi:hypothetical protein